MKIKISTIYRLTLYAALIGQAGILIGLPVRINILASFGVAMIAATCILAFVITLLDKNKDIDTSNGIICIGALAFLGVIALMLSSSLSLAGITKLLTFLQLPMYCLIAKRIGRTQVRELIYGVNLCYPVMFALFYNASFSHRYVGEYGETIHEHITLGYSNPNETGIYLMLCLIILISAVFHYKTLKMRVLCTIEAALMGYFLIDTDCRVAVFLIAVIVFLTVLCRKVYIRKAVLNAIMLIPIVFVVLLLVFPEFAELEFMGNLIDTGRSLIYSEFTQNLTFSGFLFGTFDRYGLANMHNAYITVFASLGVFSSVVFWAVLYMAYKSCCNIVIQKKENMALLFGLIAIAIHSSVETALLVSGSVYAASVFLLYYLYVSNDEITLRGVR